MKYEILISKIKDIFNEYDDFVPLHDPRFIGNEKKYMSDCIDSNFVSSVGEYVGKFEQMCADYTGSKYAVAAMNGTSALHIALKLSGVKSSDEVITQPLTFIATANGISYTGAIPVFVDVDIETMGLSPSKLEEFLDKNTEIRNDGYCYNKNTNRRISACVPMHTFGHPVKLDELINVCSKYNIALVEDAAESLGSKYKEKYTGTLGKFGILSFNGNKIITTGGGGMILTNDEELAKKAKHITTQAKIPHRWEFAHDEIGYNYRLTNISAALGCAQMEHLSSFVEYKRMLAKEYKDFFANTDIKFVEQPTNCESNYWLNAVITKNRQDRDFLLTYTNDNGVMTRPIWKLMNKLDMFTNCQCGNLENAEWLEDRVVNIPSSVHVENYFSKK
jgi:Predicted pyridoxal phosphate-dependent enzyme apparently involved in regulation of cell wall biogenesis